MSVADQAPRFASPVDQRMWSERIPAPWWIFGLILLLLPIVAKIERSSLIDDSVDE